MTDSEPNANTEVSERVAHNLQETSYFDYTYCDFCRLLLKGMTKQGLKCQECGINVHRECAQSISPYCGVDSSKSQDSQTVAQTDGSTENQINEMTASGSVTQESRENTNFNNQNQFRMPSQYTQKDQGLQQFKKRQKLQRQTKCQWKSSDWFWKGHMLYSNNIQRQMFTHFWMLDGKSINIYDRYQMRNKVLEIPLINIVNVKMSNDDEVQLNDGRTQKFIFSLRTKDNTIFYCGLDNTDMAKLTRDFYNIFRIVYMPYQSEHRKSIKISAPHYKHTDFHDEYYINPQDILGSGQFGHVYSGKCKANGKQVAIKLIDKSRFDNMETPIFQNEAIILCNFKHPGIVELDALFDFRDYLCIVTERLATDMLQMILSRKPEYLSERVTKFISYQILVALNYLHSRDIAHCDLKPENILLTENTEFPQVKICDFGYAKIIGNNSFRRTMVGTPFYSAPEIKNKKYVYFNKSNDIWSVGVMIYVSLTGVFPFMETDNIYEEIRNLSFMSPLEHLNHATEDVIDLLKNEIWQLDCHRRSQVSRVLQHKWFSEDYQLYLDLQDLETKVKSEINNSKINENWGLITNEQVEKWDTTKL